MTLPKPVRKALGEDKGGVVMASSEKSGIVLHPAVAFQIEMYSDERMAEFDEADAKLTKHIARKRV